MRVKIWFFLLILLPFWFFLALTRVSAQSAVSLSFNPPSQSVQKNQSITMDVKLNAGGKDITSVDTVISYDKDKLEFIEFRPDTSGPWGTIVENTHDAAKGELLLLIVNSSTSYPQDIKLGTLSFRTKNADGPARVSFGYQKITALDSDSALSNVTSQTALVTVGDAPPSGPTVYLTLDPPSGTKSIGQEFETTIKLVGGDDFISVLDLSISFNKDKLEVVSVSPITTGGLTSEFIKNVDNAGGTIRYFYGRPLSITQITRDSSQAVSVAKIVFKPKNSPGEATVNFTNAIVYSTTQTARLIIGTNQNANYTIAVGPTPTPTVSPAPQITFQFDPETSEKPISQEFDISLLLNAHAFDINAVEFTVNFSPQLLTFLTFTPNQAAGFTTTKDPARNKNNIDGHFTYAAIFNPANGIPPGGQIVLGTARFKAKELMGEANINYSFPAVPATSPGEGNLVAEQRAARVTIGQPIGTVSYRIAETRETLGTCQDSGPRSPYLNSDGSPEPIKTRFTLSSQPGPKTVFVLFCDNKGGQTIKSKAINYAPIPVISSAACSLSATEIGSIISITGANFAEKGNSSAVIIGNTELRGNNITLWGTDPTNPQTPKIIAKLPRRIEGVEKVSIRTKDDLRSSQVDCEVGLTTLIFSAAIECRPSRNFAEDNVSVVLVEPVANAVPLFNQRIRTDASGQPQWTAPKIEREKKYALLVKAPRTLAKKVEFQAADGTNNVEFTLAVGDITGAGGGLADGRVDQFDFSKLFSQWVLTENVTREGDLNGDSRVNSIDYSCMIKNYKKEDDKISGVILAPPIISSPTPTPVRATVTPTPTPTRVPSPTLTPTLTPTPTP